MSVQVVRRNFSSCPVCGWSGGFHSAAVHDRAASAVPERLRLEKNWWRR